MPKTTQSPGTALSALLVKNGLNYNRLAKAIGLSGAMVRLIARDENPVSAAVALRLAKFFRTKPEYWLDMQLEFDISRAAQDKKLARELKAIVTVDKVVFVRKPKAKKADKPARKGAAVKGTKPAAKKPAVKKAAGQKAAVKTPAKPTAKPVKKVAVKKAPAKKAPEKKVAVKKAPEKKPEVIVKPEPAVTEPVVNPYFYDEPGFADTEPRPVTPQPAFPAEDDDGDLMI